MKISLKTLGTKKEITGNLAVISKKGTTLFSKSVSPFDALTQNTIQKLSNEELSGLQILPGTSEVYISELPEPKGLDRLEAIRITVYKLSKAIQDRKQKSFSIIADTITAEEFSAVCQGFFNGGYTFNGYKSSAKKVNQPSLTLYISQEFKQEATAILQREETLFTAAKVCRDLVNEPGGSLTPKDFADVIQAYVKATPAVSAKIRNDKQLAKEGFNGLLTVGKGSPNTPYMATLSYTPAKAPKKTRLALVGKGVTFDTGGISIKPAASMWEMRMDMGGAATTFAAFQAIVALKLPINVTAILCLAENRPGQNAVLPGDIFTAKNGKTIQVENTDAEGRLILTDGLAEAGLQGATHVIDMATLTGAIIRAIGPKITGLFSNDDSFADSIIDAGRQNGEKFWRMPLEMEYREELDDKVADLRNIGTNAGAITAGLFLQEFIPEGSIWAHLDIAGTAFITSEWKYYAWGATGWGVRSLVTLAEKLGTK